MTLWIEVGSQECLLVVIGSCLWRGIRKDCFSLHNGQSFTFWEDVYWKNDPLKVHLANIYQLIVFVGGLFSQHGRISSWHICLHHNFNGLELEECVEFFNSLEACLVDQSVEDTLLWSLSKCGKFSVRLNHATLPLESGSCLDNFPCGLFEEGKPPLELPSLSRKPLGIAPHLK